MLYLSSYSSMTSKATFMTLVMPNNHVMDKLPTNYQNSSCNIFWVNYVLLCIYSEIAIFMIFLKKIMKIKPINLCKYAIFTLVWYIIAFSCTEICSLSEKHKNMHINGDWGIYGGFYMRRVHSNFGQIISRKLGVGHTKSRITFELLIRHSCFMYHWKRKHLKIWNVWN